MLKTTGSLEKSDPKTFRVNDEEVVDSGGSKANKTVRNLSKKSMHMPNIGTIGN